jgi:hypothetical protein
MITKLHSFVVTGLVQSYYLGRSAAPKLLHEFFCALHIAGRDVQGRGATIDEAISNALDKAGLVPRVPTVIVPQLPTITTR